MKYCKVYHRKNVIVVEFYLGGLENEPTKVKTFSTIEVEELGSQIVDWCWE